MGKLSIISRHFIISITFLGISGFVRDLPRRESIRKDDKEALRKGMQDLLSTLYGFYLVPWQEHAIQDHDALHLVCQVKKFVPDLCAGFGFESRSTHA